MAHTYEDISNRSPSERKIIARERWENIPTVIRDIVANALKLAMYEALKKLGVDATAKRSVEWAYKSQDGVLVVTVWHDHIQMSPEGNVVYYIPIERWRGVGSQVAKAEQLGIELNAQVGKTVYQGSSKQPLRFTKTGDRKLEEAYATHFIWPGKGPPPARRESE